MQTFKKDKYKIYLWSISCLVLLVSAIFQHTAYGIYGIFFSILTSMFIYVFFSTGQSINKVKLPFIIGIGIFSYTVFTSLYLARSTLIAANIICAFYFFYTLLDLQKLKINDGYKSVKRPFFYFKFVLGVIISIHCAVLLYEYGLNPIRNTGLLKDYSQASICILLFYGLVYPDVEKNTKFFAFTFFLFLAFFTPFSRTSNFLLVIFLAFIFLWEWRKGDIKNVIITLGIIASALATVYLYPVLIDMPVVQRGGFNSENLSTLNSRTAYWSITWEAIMQKPLLGYGLGSFEWSGIKGRMPFLYIANVHNDYLQIWLDLGLFWFITLVVAQIYFLLRYCPFEITRTFKITIIQKVNQQHYISWALLCCVSLYMSINFIVSFLFFQLIIAFLFAEIISNEPDKKT